MQNDIDKEIENNNYFYLNCKGTDANLYFKHWLMYAYFPEITSFANTPVNSNTAMAAYVRELFAASDYAARNHQRKVGLKYGRVFSKYQTLNKVSIAINNYLNCV